MQTNVSTHRVADVILVAVTVYNDTSIDCRVRIQNQLNGPVLPPRRAGLPVSGWDTAGYDGSVLAGERITVGYACPVDDDSIPSASEVVSVEAHADDMMNTHSPPDASITSPVDTVIRTLGRARPPIDAIPDSTSNSRLISTSTPLCSFSSYSEGDCTETRVESKTKAKAKAKSTPTPTETDPDTTSMTSESQTNQTLLPPCVDAWLADIEDRCAQSADTNLSAMNNARQTIPEETDTEATSSAPSEPTESSVKTEYRALTEVKTRIDQIITTPPHTIEQPIRALRHIATRTVHPSSSPNVSDTRYKETSVVDNSELPYCSGESSGEHADIGPATERAWSSNRDGLPE